MDPRLVDEKAELVALASLPGATNRHIKEILTLFGSPAGAWDAISAGLWCPRSAKSGTAEWKSHARKIEPSNNISDLEGKGIRTVVKGEDGYPKPLAEIHDPPWVIFYRGVLPDPQSACVAVVGSRKATPYGLEAARSLAVDLAMAGVCVVSGAAYGIDTAAHRGAMEGNGKTAAVLGCGPDVPYPRSNAGLFSRIESTGCILSEYPPGTAPLRHQFPARNRIIAGISVATVVVEASETSGALLTTDFALSEGRDVLAVPGTITSSNSRGTNALIKNGATLIIDSRDLLRELGLDASEDALHAGQQRSFTGVELALLESIDRGLPGVDEIATRAGISIPEAISHLSRLEVSGVVSRAPGGSYHRSRISRG